MGKSKKQSLEDIILILISAIGVVLFWRGVWDLSIYFINSTWSLAIGLAILLFVAIYDNQRIFEELE